MHLALDLGNVVFNVDFSELIKEFESRSIYFNEGWEFLQQYQPLIDCGHVRFSQCLKQNGIRDTQDLEKLWEKSISPSEIMFKFIEELKFEGIKIAFLSNIGLDHCQFIKKTYPDLFDKQVCHFSCEIGSRKPQKLYFQSFLWDHEEFAGALYLDDLEENLKIGKRYRLETYHFELDKFNQLSQLEQRKKLDQIKKILSNRRSD